MITYKPVGRYIEAVNEKNSGLGNHMFQIASTIGIAEKNNQPWVLPQWDHPFTSTFPSGDTNGFKLRRVSWPYRDISVSGDVVLRGYMQSEKYFKHCEDIIRDLFTFKTTPTALATEFIAVHVRRGDYNGDYHTLLGKDYYDRALATLPELPIVVFTDDRKAARDVVDKWDKITSPYNTPQEDMALMTKAKYHVIANSSFSWWGAWLSNSEKVIAPREWFGKKKARWSTKDLIPERWIRL